MPFIVYMLECADSSYYIGYTNNIEKRLHAHNNLKSGAHYTKMRRPVSVVYTEACKTKSEALKREWALKQLTREEKTKLKLA